MSERIFTVVHDPHQRRSVGARVTSKGLWQLLEAGFDDGLEVADDRFTFRLYQQKLYRLEADGKMRLWRMPMP